MQQRRGGSCLYLWVCLLLLMWMVQGGRGADDLAGKCGQVMQQVMPCLSFATGKEQAPSKDCCDASSKIKDSAPQCLCYIIEQIHKGSPEVKSMGIQEAKLVQLPDACKLKNASASNCPKLLGLSPNSPDAAIFTNISSGNASASSTVGGTTSTSQDDSYGNMLRPPLMADIMVAALAMLLVVIPTGFVSVHS